MGHVLLGTLPRTRKWRQVVGLLAGGAGAAQVANATIAAAEEALSGAARDHGLIETVWLLMQLPFAARSENFRVALYDRGVMASESPGLPELVSAISEAIDAKMPNNNGRSDLGEMAQMAASESLTEVIGRRTHGLFGSSPDDVQREVAKLATVKQFGIFAKDFFGRFTAKCLDYFVSRALSQEVGEGKRFITLAEQGEFSQALKIHCREASMIIEAYSGEWLSKANWESGGNISRGDVSRFTGYAMTKLVAELKQGAG